MIINKFELELMAQLEQQRIERAKIHARFAGRFVKPELKPSNGRTIRKVDQERFDARLEKFNKFSNNIVKVFLMIAIEWQRSKALRELEEPDFLTPIPLTKYNMLVAGGKWTDEGEFVVNRTFKDDINCLVNIFFRRISRGNNFAGWSEMSKWEAREVPLVDTTYIELLNFVIDEQPKYLDQVKQFVFSKADTNSKAINFIADLQCDAITDRFVEVMQKSART